MKRNCFGCSWQLGEKRRERGGGGGRYGMVVMPAALCDGMVCTTRVHGPSPSFPPRV